MSTGAAKPEGLTALSVGAAGIAFVRVAKDCRRPGLGSWRTQTRARRSSRVGELWPDAHQREPQG